MTESWAGPWCNHKTGASIALKDETMGSGKKLMGPVRPFLRGPQPQLPPLKKFFLFSSS